MKTTIKDIAKIAGVNHSTVSRCLNDSNLVSKETKERIKKIAEEMGFQFNSSARSLSTKKKYSIGIITSDFFDEMGAGQFFGTVIKKLVDSLEDYGYDAIFKFPFNKQGESNIKKMIGQNKIDGLIILHPDISKEDIELINKTSMPVVLLHVKPKNFRLEQFDYFITDHYSGGWQAAEYLYSKGYTQYTVVTCMPGEWEFAERTKGFCEFLESKGIDDDSVQIINSDINIDAGRELARQKKELFLSKGVFVQADVIAAGIVSILGNEAAGIVGYDDVAVSRMYDFTTIHQPVERLAHLAADRIIALIKGDSKEIGEQVIKPTLVIRNT